MRSFIYHVKFVQGVCRYSNGNSEVVAYWLEVGANFSILDHDVFSWLLDLQNMKSSQSVILHLYQSIDCIWCTSLTRVGFRYDNLWFASCVFPVWADHGDDISIQYSRTGALKGDFVRYVLFCCLEFGDVDTLPCTYPLLSVLWSATLEALGKCASSCGWVTWSVYNQMC